MKQIEVNGKQIEIIERLSETKINKFELILLNYYNEFDNEIDRFVNVLSLASNLSIDEVEELDLDLFKDLVTSLNINDLDESQELPTTDFVFDGITYNRVKNINEVKLTVKEMRLLQNAISLNKNKFVGILASIIYIPTGENLTEESISKRKEILENNMSMDYIIPFLIKVKDLNGLQPK